MHSIRKVKVLKRYIKHIQQVYLLIGIVETSTVDYKASENVSNFLQTMAWKMKAWWSLELDFIQK